MPGRAWLLALLFACAPAGTALTIPTTPPPPPAATPIASTTTPTATASERSIATSIVARIERSPSFCMGSGCTAYKASVYENGEVIWEGISGVRLKGLARAKLTSAELDQLRDAFRHAGFFSYLPVYDCSEKTDASIILCGSDAPTCRLTFSDGERIMTVVHDLGDGQAPKTLTSLEERVDEIIGTARWVK